MILISKDRYFEIEQEVFYTLEDTHTSSFPVMAQDIARALHITLVPYSDLSPEDYEKAMQESEDGYSFYDYEPGTDILVYYIHYNDDKPRHRKKWTICHEIGHIRLGHHDGNLSYEEAEQEANYFAKYLLAPYPMVQICGCEDPWDVSDTFDVSLEAASYIWDSYLKWSSYRPIENIPQEERLIQLFCAA